MSSSEIIELNSSDEETEKKPKKKKPRLDAMVAIPNQNISGLKIHNVSRPFTPLNNFPRVRAPQVATRVHLPIGVRPNFPQAAKIRPLYSPRRATPNMQFPKIINTMSLNGRPVTQISPRKPTRLNVNPVSIAKMAKNCKNSTKSPNQSKSLHDLPPGITVTRTTGQPKRKIVQRPALPPSIVIKKTAVSEITLDDDDDDLTEVCIDANAQIVPIEFEVPPLDPSSNVTSTCISNTTEENENSKAPETPLKNTNKQYTITEIVIEDSPIKLVVESAARQLMCDKIIIEDSPLKKYFEPVNDEDKTDYHSRKMLDFSKESSFSQEEKKEDNEKGQNNIPVAVNSKPKKEKSLKSNILKQVENEEDEEPEFHEIYQKFIKACLKVESSDDMKRIVEKKVKAYYREVDKKLTESNSFVELVTAKISAMETQPTNSFLHIKDIVDQLSIWRNNQKIVLSAENLDTEKKEENKQRHLRKLERALQKLHRAIQKLEEKEVDFDDDADSVYLLTDRYKARLVRIHDKICELTGTRVPPAVAPLVLQPPPGAAKGPTAKLQAWLNKPGKCASVLPFPDFHDVLGCVREANREDQLGWTESQLEDEARILFTHCGKILQKRRQEMEWRLAASRLPAESDPAECDQGLQAQLKDNEKIAVKREQDVFNRFADRQTQLKLEAEEISDIEVGKTDKSDGSDDDEVIFLDELSQDIEAGTSKEFPKPVLDKDIKNETSDREDTVTAESKRDELTDIDTNRDMKEKERNSEDSDSTLKTLSSDSEDMFKVKTGISDSERVDLESDEESSIYSVVSGSSQDGGNSNSSVPKNTSDTEEVIEFLDDESMANTNNTIAPQDVGENRSSLNLVSLAKVVDLDEESKDGDSTEVINRDRIVRIDSESLDEQIFLNVKKSNVTETCRSEEIKELKDIKITAKSTDNISDIVVSPAKKTENSEFVNEEISQGKDVSTSEEKDCLEIVNDKTGKPVSEMSGSVMEMDQILDTENLLTILETHSLRNKDKTNIKDNIYLNEENKTTEGFETTEKCIDANDEVLENSSDDMHYEKNQKDCLDSRRQKEEKITEKIDHSKIMVDKRNQESKSEDTIQKTKKGHVENRHLENNLKITKIQPTKVTEETKNMKPVDSVRDKLVNSGKVENELLNGSQGAGTKTGIGLETNLETEKKQFFCENDNAIENNDNSEETNEIVEKIDIFGTETSTKDNDEVLEFTAETDVVMEAV